jgi:hypothetical protein
MASDIQSVRVTATGEAYGGPARLRKVTFVTATGTPRLTLTDGTGGPTRLDVSAHSAANTVDLDIPDSGIRFETSLVVSTLTNVSAVTLFYS